MREAARLVGRDALRDVFFLEQVAMQFELGAQLSSRRPEKVARVRTSHRVNQPITLALLQDGGDRAGDRIPALGFAGQLLAPRRVNR